MNCPKCSNIAMAEESHGTVTIDRCPECHGMWLDVFELEQLLEVDPRPLIAEDRKFISKEPHAEHRLNCPRCSGAYLIKLNSRLRPGTIVDNCKTCFGTWLDAGELTRLARKDSWGWLLKMFGR